MQTKLQLQRGWNDCEWQWCGYSEYALYDGKTGKKQLQPNILQINLKEIGANMYFFGLTGLGLLVYLMNTVSLSDMQAFALALGGLFVNIAGWLHGHNQAKEAFEKEKLYK